jgi:hypothetical protein
MWDEDILACQRREEAFSAQNKLHKEEEEIPTAPKPRFSIRLIVEEDSPAYVRLATNFSWEEF